MVVEFIAKNRPIQSVHITRNSKSKKARPKNGHRKKEQQNAIQKNKDCATGALQQTGVNTGAPESSC
jgi:hypothetical protein